MPTLTFQGGPFDGDKVSVDADTLETLASMVRGMKNTGFIVVESYVFFVESSKGGSVKVQVHGMTAAERSAVYRMPISWTALRNRRLSFVGWE